mgnify:FL=1
MASISCERVSTYAVDDAWEPAVSDSEIELFRVVEVQNLSVALDRSSPDGRVETFQQPLIRAPALLVRMCIPLGSEVCD